MFFLILDYAINAFFNSIFFLCNQVTFEFLSPYFVKTSMYICSYNFL